MAEVQLFCTIPPYFNVKINPTKCFVVSCTRDDYEKTLAEFDRYNKKTFISYADNSHVILGPVRGDSHPAPFWYSDRQYSILLKPDSEGCFRFCKLIDGYSIDRQNCFEIEDFQLHFYVFDDEAYYTANLKAYKGEDLNKEVLLAFEKVDSEKREIKRYDVIMQRDLDELISQELFGQNEYKVITDGIEKLINENRATLKLIYKFVPKVMLRFDQLHGGNFGVALCIYNIHISKSLVTVVLLGKFNMQTKSFDAINVKDVLCRIQRSIEALCKGWHNNSLLNNVMNSIYK